MQETPNLQHVAVGAGACVVCKVTYTLLHDADIHTQWGVYFPYPQLHIKLTM